MSDWYSRFGFYKYGGLAGGDGWRYHFSWLDARWAVPALVGETGSDAGRAAGEAVLWTMAQRLYLLRGQEFRGRDGSVHRPPHLLHELMIDYCSPINPYFRTRGGSFLERRREDFSTMPPEAFSPAVHNLVLRFMRGEVPMRPQFAGLVDFADCDCVGCGRDVHGSEDLLLGNCFWKSDATRGWTVETVRPVGIGGGGGGMLLPLLIGAGAVGIYLAATGKVSGWWGAAAAAPVLPP